MMTPAPSQQEKRTIKVRDFLIDFHAGMEDAQLLMKYQLTPIGLEKFYSMLVERGILEVGEVEARYKANPGDHDLAKQSDPMKSSFICPSCLAAHDTMFDICPCCGVSFQGLMSVRPEAALPKPEEEDAFVPGQSRREDRNSEFFAAADHNRASRSLHPGRVSAGHSAANSEQNESAGTYRWGSGSPASFDDSLDEIITGMPLDEYYGESSQSVTERQGRCDQCDVETKPALRDIYDRARSVRVLGISGIALLLGFIFAVALSLFDGYSFGRLLVVYCTALFFLCGGVFLAVGSFFYFAREKVFYCSSCGRVFPRA